MSFDPERFPFESLLPQTGDMCLLDRLLAVDEESARAEFTVREDSLFALADGSVPAWVGLEYMAQAIAAWSGYHYLRHGEQIRLGLLLGTRHFESQVASFACGGILTVSIARQFEAANDMSVFECVIEHGEPIARASLNVLLPKDIQPYLNPKQEAVE